MVDEREHPELAPILDIVRDDLADEYVTDVTGLAWERLRLALVALLNQRDKYKTLADEVVGDWRLAQRQADRMEAERDEARRIAERVRDAFTPASMWVETDGMATIPHPWREVFPWESSSVSEGENNT